ncbi:MAG: DUF5916 domain-containing protein [Rhodothermales bacterium]
MKKIICLFATSHRFFQVIALVGALSANVLTAQGQEMSLVKHSEVIQIDGRVDEPVWDGIAPLESKQKVPNAGAPPTQRTEMRITYDDDFLYLSCRMFDTNPELIIANTKKRDDFTENTEWCGFLIDTYNDRENALAFYVTPMGSKLDMAIANDAEGANGFNLSWDSYWEAAALIDDQGWHAELKIPFSILPFEVNDEKVIMGITAFRYLARNDETDIFPPRDPALGSSFKPSLTQKIAFEGIKRHNPVHVTPYILSGREVVHSIAGAGDRYEGASSFINQVGLDAKIALRSNATLDVTVNTDFAQVEADDQQINLTRLNLFFPEKRQFFQERSSLFDFSFGALDKVFHSRRIGIVDGEQTQIYGGMRVFGRFDKLELGALSMQTGSRNEVGSENFGVFRVRRNVLNENSTIGAILTNRTDFNGAFNTVYGLDATLRFLKQNYASFRIAQSSTNGVAHDLLSSDASKVFFEIEKRSLDKLTYKLNYSRAGANYNPAMGFEQREDAAQVNYNIGYNFFPDASSTVLQVGPYVSGNLIWDNPTNVQETRNLFLGAQALTKSGWTYDAHVRTYREETLQPLSFPRGVVIPEGIYDFASLAATVVTSSAKRLSYAAFVEAGAFYNGRRLALNISSLLNITPDLILETGIDYNLLDMPGIQDPVSIRLLRLKVSYNVSTKLFLSAITQFNNVSQAVLSNVRIRYNAKDGNDFYLVYNTDFNQHRNRLLPALPVSNQGTLLVKYNYTFHF